MCLIAEQIKTVILEKEKSSAHPLRPLIGTPVRASPPEPRAGSHSWPSKPQCGFTLIELIVVMVLIGILAVVAIPRLEDQTFAQRSFHDQTLAALRYAQKSAVAQRRTVCVGFSSNSVTLTITNLVACDTALASPSAGAYTVTAPSGVNFTATPTGFNFNALGQASAAPSIQVNGMAQTITVEQETGYVH